MRKWIPYFVGFFLSLPGLVAGETTTNHQVLVIVGASGEDAYADGFEQAAKSWEKACKAANASLEFIGREVNPDSTDRDQIHDWIQNLDPEAASPVWIIYIGHGTYNRRDAYLNLTGPDLSAKDFARWIPSMDRTLIFVHGGSAASPFITALSGQNRILISATRNPDEINYARFGERFTEVIANSEGDIDQDGQTSLLEAFLSAANRVEAFYKETGRLSSEHALLDDNGDKLGTPPDWFRGVRIIKRAKGGQEPDGFRAHQIALIPSEQEKLLTPEQRQQRDTLEAELENLRKQKESLAEDDFYGKLEAVLLELSKLYFPRDSEGNLLNSEMDPEDS